VISGFRHEVADNCALLGYYAASSGNSLPTFRDNLSGPIFNGQEFKNGGRISYSEMSVRNYHYPLRNSPEERSAEVQLYYFYLMTGVDLASEVQCVSSEHQNWTMSVVVLHKEEVL